MATPLIQSSFAAGEISPSLYARTDLAKYHVGAAAVNNFFVDYRGGASTRAGSRFITPVKESEKKHRLHDFIVGDLTTYVLIFGDKNVRFLAKGAPIVEAPKTITDITNATPAILTIIAHGFSDGEWVYIEGVGGATVINDRTFLVDKHSADTISLKSLFSGFTVHTPGVYTGGGTASRIYELETPWASTDLAKLNFAQSADVLTVVHPDFPPYDIARLTASTFSITQFDPGPKIATPTNLAGTATDGGHLHNQRYGYVVTAQDENGREESLPSTSFEIENNFLIQNDSPPVANNLTWNAVSTASFYNIYKWGGIPVAEPSQTVFGFIGQAVSPVFTDNNIAPDITRQPPQFRNPFTNTTPEGAILKIIMDTRGSGYDEFNFPPIVTIGGDGTGATAHAVLDQIGAGKVSHIDIDTGGQDYTVAGATVIITGAQTTNATAHVSEVRGAQPTSIFPAVVSYFQQRRVFAATRDEPETLWFSQIGLPYNFDVSPAVLPNEAVTASLASLQVNAIAALVPTSQGLVGFTSAGVWIISGKSAQESIAPDNISALPQASPGAAANMPPLLINTNILYVQFMGSVVRDITFDINSFSLVGKDRSELAMHLFFGYTLKEWCLAEEPFHLVWAVRDDGYMLTLTYVPQHDVYAWARQSTYGLYQSVCSVPEPPTNAVYTIVQRFIRDKWMLLVERFADRDWGEDIEFAWSLDSALRLPQTYPAGNLLVAAANGDGVAASSTSDVFISSDAGKVLRVGGGRATVVSFIDTKNVTIDIDHKITAVIPGQGGLPQPFFEGDWTLDEPITIVGGLEHLDGQMITALADGNLYTGLPVSFTGHITLPHKATVVTAGLEYPARLQTLYLDAGEPTIQGKLKVIPTVTLRVQEARGLQVGPTFARLVPVKEEVGIPIPLFTGDRRANQLNKWDRLGQVCIETTPGLPATVLGVIPEVEIGSS